MQRSIYMIAAAQPVDLVGATTTGYGIVAYALVALMISVFVAAVVSAVFFAIRRSARHHHGAS